MKADLHTHSYMSDGTLSPREVVRAAHDAGVELLALTDHDTFAGCLEAADEGKKLGVTVISGIEIDTWNGEEEIHICSGSILIWRTQSFARRCGGRWRNERSELRR